MGTTTSLIDRVVDRIVDPDIDLADHPISPLAKIWGRTRYTAARRGFALTANERRIRSFHNSLVGERVWVIGNGPSIRNTDLSLLRGETTIGTNSIFLNRGQMGYDPTHYVVEDYLVAEDRAADIAAITGSTKWFGNYLRYALPDAPDTLWTNVSVDYRERPEWPRFSRDAGRMMHVGGTVTYLCIQLAYYLGASEVVLVGVDHSYEVPEDEPLDGNTITSTRDDVNHFHSDYFGAGKRWHLPRVDRMERAYVRARQVFDDDGRRIVNATKGGALEVFPRVDFDALTV
ncbi:MAG TPA: hypothetical protein DDW61_05955 [Actinobacteria bacterium]|nr:hypothetical protein [Actinomycetota bacterium]